MKEAFEKIVERLEEPQFNIGCGACPIKEKCDEVQEAIDDEMTDLCAETMRVIAKEIVQEVEKEYNNGWIACSERLPEPTRPVLITLKNWTNEKLIVRQGRFHIDHWRTEEGIIENNIVIAWQPLPVPYKESD